MKNQKESPQEITENKKLENITKNLKKQPEDPAIKKMKAEEAKQKKKEKKKQQFKQKVDSFKEMVKGESKKQKNESQTFWGKTFLPIILVFLLYSLALVSRIKGSVNETWLDYVFDAITFGNSYSMGVALVFSFIIMMILFCNNKFKVFLFGKKTVIKQMVFMAVLIVGNFFLCNYLIENDINIMPLLFILAMFWLIFQGVRLYFGARTFSTRLESKVLSRYSSIRYALVIIIPFTILIFLTTAVWSYRYFLVLLTLEVIAFFVPVDGLRMYSLEMTIILPFLYISLITIFMLILVEFVLTRRKSDNRRAGAFDNFAYSLIVFFMFFYLLYQVSLYLFLNKDTIEALKNIGGGSTGTSYLFLVEFIISMLFLFRAISKVGKSFGWNVLFLNQDAMVMGFLATVMSQTTSRVALFSNISSQQLGAVTNLLSMDHLIIPIVIMAFLGITILIYYIKPQEMSMFMRIAKEAVDEEDKAMDIILKFLKREFIRRGSKFPLSEVESQLLQITNLPKGLAISLVKRIPDKYMDCQILSENTENGIERYIDFIPITEKYQGDKAAEDRARQYMSSRLADTLSKQKKKISLGKTTTDVAERGSFIDALGSQYTKKVKDEEKRKQNVEDSRKKIEEKFSLDVDPDTIDVIYAIIKNEYLYRVQHPLEYPDCRIKISEVADKVYTATKVSSGILYPLLGKITDDNINMIVVDTDGDLNTILDKHIDFVPVDDFEISDALAEHRPEKLKYLKNLLWTLLYTSLTMKRNDMVNNIKIEMDPSEMRNYDVYLPENFRTDFYFYILMENFNNNLLRRMNQFPWNKRYMSLWNVVSYFYLKQSQKEKK